MPLSSGYAPHITAFDWPEDVVSTLRSGLHLSDTHLYTEQQADDLLANALVRLSHLAQGRTAGERAARSDRLVSASFMPRHSYYTDGVDGDGPERLPTQRWSSLPLLAAPPTGPDDVNDLQTQMSDGRRARSLDLIRFDRFSPRVHNGFWLPTAIVRPVLRPGARNVKERLDFEVIYEFPTSPVIFRNLFRESPERAWGHLRQVLERKQCVWLSKLAPSDQRLISNMWQRSHESMLLPVSPFFEKTERKAWAAQHGESYYQILRGPSHAPAETSGRHRALGTSDPDGDRSSRPAHSVESGSSGRPSKQHDTTGTSATESDRARPIVEHDFFNILESGQPSRVHESQLQRPPTNSQASLGDQAPNSRSNVDLDLTLGAVPAAKRLKPSSPS